MGVVRHGVKHPGRGINQPHPLASTGTAQAAQEDQPLSILIILIRPHSLKYIVSHKFPLRIRNSTIKDLKLLSYRRDFLVKYY
jgi:hypothetical protein